MDPHASPENGRWIEIDALFQAALRRAPEERRAFVRESSAGDKELASAVDALLDASEEAQGFLEGTAFVTLPGSSLSELAAELVNESLLPGEPIGPYRVLRRLARGGMGTVYLAERADGQFEARVALKVLRRGLDTEDVLGRFLTERQILASLEHPNIARLLDGGETRDGRPYLVMEYVQGEPIDVYCQERRLSIEDRLRLFLTVAGAVQFAHSHLVVHRDLKPSNILVTPAGRVKLLDFGVAKLLDGSPLPAEAPHTRHGAHLLTPKYASPEQVRGGPITIASDVYQLGVLLYELLAGALPYRQTGSAEALGAAIAVEEPEPPSVAVCWHITSPERARHLRRELRGDLDTIVLQTLRKEPSRRYASVEHLAGDIRRYLAGLPVSARADTWRYRTGKFIRRNRWGVAVVAAVAVLLIGSVAALSSYARRLEVERNTARLEATKASEISDFLVRLFEVSNPDVGRGNTITAREILDVGAERVRSELSTQPEVQASLMALIAQVYKSLGIVERAEVLAIDALRLRQREFGLLHPEVVQSWILLGDILDGTRPDSARVVYSHALKVAERVHGPDHPSIATVLINLATYVETDPVRRREFSDRALSILRRSGDASRLQLADALVLSTHGDEGHLPLETRRERLDEAIALYRSLGSEQEPKIAEAMNDMALMLEAADPVATDTLLRQAIQIHRRAAGEKHPTTLTLMNNYAAMLRDREDWAEAEAAYRQVLRMRRTHSENRINLGYTLYGLGRVLMERGKPAEAESLLREAAPIFGEGDQRRHRIRIAWAESLAAQRAYDQAEAVLLESWNQLDTGSSRLEPLKQQVQDALASLRERRGASERTAGQTPDRP